MTRLFLKDDLSRALSELFPEKPYDAALQEVVQNGPHAAYNEALEKAPPTPDLNAALSVLNQFHLVCERQKRALGEAFTPQTLIADALPPAPPPPVAGPGLKEAVWAVPVFVGRVWFAAGRVLGRVSGLTKSKSGEEDITRPGYILEPLKWPFEALIGDKLPDRSSPSVAEPGLWDAVFAVPVFVGRGFFAIARVCGFTKPQPGEEDITRPGYILEPLKWLSVLVGRGVTGAPPPEAEADAVSVWGAIRPRYVTGETGLLRDPGELGPAITYKVGQMVAVTGLLGMVGSGTILPLLHQPLAAAVDRFEDKVRREAIADVQKSESLADMQETAMHYKRQAAFVKGVRQHAPDVDTAFLGLCSATAVAGLAMKGSVARRQSSGGQQITEPEDLTAGAAMLAAVPQPESLPIAVVSTGRER